MNNVRIAIKLLTPICNLIVEFQNDTKPISDVYEAFCTLRDEFNKMQGLSPETLPIINETIDHYWEFLKNPCHVFSNLIDPRYIGRSMGAAERHAIIEEFHESYPEAAEELDSFFAFCRTHSKTAIFNGLRSGKTTVITWWEGQMEFNNLRDVALKLFSLVAANSACEKFFLNFAFIHSKSRNRLGNEKARKCVYVFANSKEYKEWRDNRADDETENDDSEDDDLEDELENDDDGQGDNQFDFE